MGLFFARPYLIYGIIPHHKVVWDTEGMASLKEKLGCNQPRKTPGHPSKSHVVKACEDGEEKLVRFGQQGVEGSPPKAGESEEERRRRESFKARHGENIRRGKFSAAFWADRVKW